jgi:hypothetical protein
VIAPLILVFGIIYFGALWILYRYYPPKLSDLDLGAKGLFYPTAIRQLLMGIYFMELCLAGLFFLVRDADDKPACTAQAIIMIAATGLTALFHYVLDHGNGLNWLSLQVILKWRAAQTSSKGKGMPNRGCRREAEQLSTAKLRIFEADLSQDETLSPARPILWIPKDELRIADDENLPCEEKP